MSSFSQASVSLESLFIQVALKLYVNLTNTTGETLLLDRLESPIKIYILRSILEEIQKLCINISYYSSKKTNVKYKVDRFLQLIFIRITKKLNQDLFSLNNSQDFENHSEIKWLLKNFEIENGELVKLLLIQLTSMDPFEAGGPLGYKKKTNNEKLLISLLENITLKFSNVILYNLVLNFKISSSIFKQVSGFEVSSLKVQKNNLYWSSYLQSTFFRPKYIYTSLYVLKVINYDGFCHKLVHMPILRMHEEKNLTALQFIVLLYFEVLDFLFPKVLNSLNLLKTSFIKKLSVYP